MKKTTEAKTLEEWEEEHKQWKKNHPILNFIQYDLYWPTYRFVNSYLNPVNWYREIKWFFQRGIRGWSERDTWSYFSYNAKVNYEALKWLKKYKHGIPNQVFADIKEQRGYTDEEFNEAQKKWDSILDEMIFAFEMIKKSEYDGTIEMFYPSKDDPNKHCLDGTSFSKKYPDHYLMTKEEDDRIKNGMKLFIEHYFSLWD